MIKKTLALLLLVSLSGCQLVKTPPLDSDFFSDDYLIGFYGKVVDENFNSILLESEVDNLAFYVYQKEDYITAHIGGYLSKVKEHITISANNQVRSSMKLEATLFYNYQLFSKIVSFQNVFQKSNQDIYIEDYFNAYTINGNIVSISQSQEMTYSRTNSQGETEETQYQCEYIVNLKMIDLLMGVKVLEFDSNNVLIKSTSLLESAVSDFQTNSNCEYVIIQEENQGFDGSINYVRTIYNKNSSSTYELYYPVGNGFVKPLLLKIIF